MASPVRRSGNKGRGRTVAGLAAVLFALVALTGCLNMQDQPSFRRQEPPRLSYPAASVPSTGKPATYNEQQAGTLQNPLAGNQEAAQAGATHYAINCRMCHGDDGKGTGAIAQYFPPMPADLTSDRVKGQPDGRIFWVISNGFGRMPGFQEVLTTDQRWQTVNYVRSLQQR